MNKLKIYVGLVLLSLNTYVFAEDTIPDPMVQITTPPVGLPAINDTNINIEKKEDLVFKGVLIIKNENNTVNNKVFINEDVYKVNDIINNVWKVKFISKKQVVLNNIKTKELKKINISGE